MNSLKSPETIRLSIKILLFFIFLYFLQIAVGYIIIRTNYLSQSRKSLIRLADRIHSDLKYNNGVWDTTLYTSDPDTPHPNGSSGFAKTIYIMTSDGFIIERNLPIHGYLDSSDFKHLLTFSAPTTLNSVTNENWRVQSAPIKDGNDTIGVIFVSLYSPDTDLESADKQLQSNLNSISSDIQIKNKQIDASHLDVRNVHYDVSFEIVNKFNKVLANNGRTPSYIDPSYIVNEISNSSEKILKDSSTGESYLLETTVISDKKGNPVGVIVLGDSLKSNLELLNNYFIYSSLASILFIIPTTAISIYIWRKELHNMVANKTHIAHLRRQPKRIAFDKKASTLNIDGSIISIPYASNQYYMSEALFLHPKKRWEQDELLERFGEEAVGENWRKVYDAMLAINKKASIKLIVYQDKTYRVNPIYLEAVIWS